MDSKFGESTQSQSSRQEAFERVALKEMDMLYRVAFRFCRNSSVAEDLVGQTFLCAAKAWQRFDGAHPRSWLIKILRNEYLGWLKEQIKQPLSLDIIEESGSLPDPSSGDPIENLDVLKAVDSLDEPDRTIVIMSDLEDLSSQEVGEALGMRPGAVRLRLFRARHALRRKLVGWEVAE